ATDLLHIHRLALVGEARIAGDDEQPADVGECRNDLLDHAVSEIFLLLVAAHVGERKHRNRGLIGKRKQRSYNRGSDRRCFASDPVWLDRLGDVLHLLLTEIDELDRQLRPDLVPYRTRDADGTGFSKRLQPGRHVDPIAEKVVALNDYVADVNA